MNIEVKNRSNGTCVYNIPELGDRRNIRREFAPQETKKIDLEELKALTYIPGGTKLLSDYLQILDKKALEELNIYPEIEYDLSEEDIKNLMLNGSLDSFLDCLDFAPEGVIDLIKKFSITLPLNDSLKRDAIKEKTGFDVDKALLRIKEDKVEETAQNKPNQKSRRVDPTKKDLPKYNIVS